VWAANFLAHSLVGAAAYLLLIGRATPHDAQTAIQQDRLTRSQWMTVAAIAGWIVGVVGFKLHIGLSAFAAAAAVIIASAARNETAAIKAQCRGAPS
jgi:hypothetical protein